MLAIGLTVISHSRYALFRGWDLSALAAPHFLLLLIYSNRIAPLETFAQIMSEDGTMKYTDRQKLMVVILTIFKEDAEKDKVNNVEEMLSQTKKLRKQSDAMDCLSMRALP